MQEGIEPSRLYGFQTDEHGTERLLEHTAAHAHAVWHQRRGLIMAFPIPGEETCAAVRARLLASDAAVW